MASIMVTCIHITMWLKCYPQIFCGVGILFVKAIISYLNLKPDNGFLPCNMSVLFSKTRHGLTDIVLPEIYTSFGPRVFWGIMVHSYISCVLEKETESHPPWLGPVSKMFLRA